MLLKYYFIETRWVETRTHLGRPDWRLLWDFMPEKIMGCVMILALEVEKLIDLRNIKKLS